MPQNIIVSVTPGVLPQGYCYPADPQQFNSDIVSIISATIPGNFSLFNYGPNTPPVDQQDIPWARTDNSGVIEGWYSFIGAWVRLYPTPPSSSERRMWVGTEDSLKTYDGGQDAPITDRTGPFWEVDHAMDFRFPVGPGTLGSTTINVTDTGGAADQTIGAGSIPDHRHLMPFYLNDRVFTNPELPWDKSGGTVALPASPLLHSVQVTDNSWADNYEIYTNYVSGGTGGGGPVTPVPTMPPYVGTFFIKRTARVLIVAPNTTPPVTSGVIIVGVGPPSPSLGQSGDAYIDTTPGTGGLYWKMDDGWHP